MSLRALSALLLASAAAAAPTSSFSCAISTITLHAGDAPYEVCSYSGQPGGYISLQWFTSTFAGGEGSGKGGDGVLISIYLDGEANASLSFYPWELTGFPSLEALNSTADRSVWSSALWGRNSATSFTNNVAIPFLSGLRITLQFMPAAGESTVYYQAHGLFGLNPSFGGLPLPAGARLQLQKHALTLAPLDYLPIVSASSGSGMVVAIAIAFAATNLK
jgi:hypothetical protein